MIVAELYNQLGNQMLIYSEVKSICIEKHHDFYFVPIAIKNEKEINDRGKKYGKEIYTIFDSVLPEMLRKNDVEQIKFDYVVDYVELIPLLEKGISNDKKILVKKGEMVTTTLKKTIEIISGWFHFPEDVRIQGNKELEELRRDNTTIVSVHFRCGKDYLRGAYQLESKYWINAAKFLLDKLGEHLLFLIFCDDKNAYAVKRFEKKYSKKCYFSKGDLVEDLYLMSQCDAHIVCNSTFSVMGALLDSNKKHITIRPLKAPCGTGYMSDELYLKEDNWKSVGQGRRSIGAFIFKLIRIILRK
mgnify:CR=1 FL=1